MLWTNFLKTVVAMCKILKKKVAAMVKKTICFGVLSTEKAWSRAQKSFYNAAGADGMINRSNLEAWVGRHPELWAMLQVGML